MNQYAGKICPYCKAELTDEDDIVLCSQCENAASQGLLGRKPGLYHLWLQRNHPDPDPGHTQARDASCPKL